MFILAVIFILNSASAQTPPAWVHHARQLIGENQGTREQAVAELKKVFPSAGSILPELDGPNRNYALDVAVALKFPDAVPKLLPMVENDRDGAVTLAINALMDERTFRPIGEYYIRFLEQKPLHSVAVPVLMAMVDYFTHLKFRCEEGLFTSLLNHPRLEVQQAAALHFAILKDKKIDKLIKKNFTQLYPQVRAQIALTFFDRNDLKETRKICAADSDPIVKSACDGLDLKGKAKDKKEKRGKRKKKLK